jgi:hypothetical protein
MPGLESEFLKCVRSAESRRKDKTGCASLSLQSSNSASVAVKRFEVVEDVVMMVSNDITAILCQVR